MNREQYTAVLQGLKQCEKNYAYHVREFGTLDDSDINLWSNHQKDLPAEKIDTNFLLHIQRSKWFPTIADIRDAKNIWGENRKVADRWKRPPIVEPSRLLEGGSQEKNPMPVEVKKRINDLIEKCLEDPKVRKSYEKQKRAMDGVRSCRKKANRNSSYKPRGGSGSGMSEQEQMEIFYRK